MYLHTVRAGAWHKYINQWIPILNLSFVHLEVATCNYGKPIGNGWECICIHYP